MTSDAAKDVNESSLVIESGIGEWRATTIGADGLPLDIQFLSDSSLSSVDVIYHARVREVNKTLDMAFLDLGAEPDSGNSHQKTGVLNFRRVKHLAKHLANHIANQKSKQPIKPPPQSIADCVNEGEMLLVQGLSDPTALEDKAIQLSAKPRLVGRFTVVEAAKPRLFFSKDLPPRCIKALTPLLSPLAAQVSIIVRSNALDMDPTAVLAEASWLATAFVNKGDAKKPAPVFALSPLEQALMLAPKGCGSILVENGDILTQAKQICRDRWPDLFDRLSIWAGQETMDEAFGISEAIEEALAPRIALPSGGWISIEETRALTVIDVNVGSALQGRSAAVALLTVNMEAALAALYHLRLQDIGGLIVIDFVDMSAKGSAAQLMQVIDDALKQDPVPIKRSGLSQFGLMELARRRKGLSLRQRFQQSRSPVLSVRAVALQLVKQALALGLTASPGTLVLTAPGPVMDFLEKHHPLMTQIRAKSHRELQLKRGDKISVTLQEG